MPQIGLHFMIPVPVMPLVELIRATQTNDEVGNVLVTEQNLPHETGMTFIWLLQTFAKAKEQAELLGKSVCVSQDRPGMCGQHMISQVH